MRTEPRTWLRTDNRTRNRADLGIPGSLFSSGEQGAWWDPSDLSTLYQDAAGTTAVTAVEQAVGLMLDKRLGLPLGTELVSNNTFDTDTVWTKGTDWSIGSGVATKVAGVASALAQTVTLTAGTTYRLVFTITRTAGSVAPRFTGGTTVTGTSRSASGTYVQFLTAVSGNTTLDFNSSTTFAGTVDNVYLKAVSGNDAVQVTSAARPTLRARYNQLTYSEQFDNADWVKTDITPSSNTDTAPDGTLTADTLAATGANGTALQSFTALATSYIFSVWLKRKTGTGNIDITAGSGTYVTQTVTSDWTRFTVTQTLTAGSRSPGIRIVTSGDEVYAWGAQLMPANNIAGNAYQRIADAATYTTISTIDGTQFLPYLSFDGTDDAMVTQSVDFTGTDAVSIFTGITRNNTSTFSMIVELPGATAAFALWAPFDGTRYYYFRSRGTSASDAASGSSFSTPETVVLTARGDISEDLSNVARNGVSVGNGTADQGSGNYGNAAMSIGDRPLSSHFFNGRIYALIVRGATSDSSQIAATNLWVGSKCGVTL